MSTVQFTLFDIPSKSPQRCWSSNTWTTRILLNYKGLDYKTEWIEYPDIRPRLQAHVSPDADGDYTCPTIIWPDGTYLMDSKAIAPAIEEKYPTPPMPINAPVHPRFIAPLRRAMTELRPVFVAQVPKKILGERSLPYFIETREKSLGMTLEKLEDDNPIIECFKKASPALHEIAEILKEDASGPFLQGSRVVYSDIVLASSLLFFKSMGTEIFEELLKSTGDRGVFEKFLEAMSPWTDRNDH